jgi:hypothetical protein
MTSVHLTAAVAIAAAAVHLTAAMMAAAAVVFLCYGCRRS